MKFLSAYKIALSIVRVKGSRLHGPNKSDGIKFSRSLAWFIWLAWRAFLPTFLFFMCKSVIL